MSVHIRVEPVSLLLNIANNFNHNSQTYEWKSWLYIYIKHQKIRDLILFITIACGAVLTLLWEKL